MPAQADFQIIRRKGRVVIEFNSDLLFLPGFNIVETFIVDLISAGDAMGLA
jgi:hypothetical protein